MENYEQKYKDALGWIKDIYPTFEGATKEDAEHYFPELKESEDERIRKFLIDLVNNWKTTFPLDLSKLNVLAWLEKQGEESKRLYVRFGEIPEDECSGVYHAGELVGKEEGVSVYDAKIDNHDNVLICIPLPINENTLDTLQNLVEYENRNCYLVKGTCVGKGSDDEPIIRNVSIVKRIDNYRIKESDKKSDQNLDNFCKTCKDEQKPTDKVEPKFKVGQTIIYKGTENMGLTKMTISDIAKGQYWDDNCCIVPISDQDNWELVEQKPAWSEEDEIKLKTTMAFLKHPNTIDDNKGVREKVIEWLKSIKERMKGE